MKNILCIYFLITLPQEIWNSNEDTCVCDIVKEAKADSANPLNKATSVIEEFGTDGRPVAAKDWREDKGSEANNPKHKAILPIFMD